MSCPRHLMKSYYSPDYQKRGCAMRKDLSSNNKNLLRISAQQKRGDQFDKVFIACIRHPDRRVNRSGYVGYGKKLCGSCKTNRRRDGSTRPAHVRNVNKRNYKKSLNLRKYYLGGRLYGLNLFQRFVP